MNGYVYFARMARGNGNGGVKIGWSKDPIKRGKALTSEVGTTITIDGAIPGTKKDERAIHEILQHVRCHGEWFLTNTPQIRRFINEMIAAKAVPPDIHTEKSQYRFRLGGRPSP